MKTLVDILLFLSGHQSCVTSGRCAAPLILSLYFHRPCLTNSDTHSWAHRPVNI